ncbi:MAG: class I SAM-dependent methyltransferase [Phenylobacterium sp.]|uniref:class I SAM-dependent methyltransferase n=1 Tax=Phenylobacterium sp. TaxID=1871053 RepID=UPI001A4A536E|nr:class I SAM-dependent methyltransferase [Phenylobacterium sp.]MBL8773480.1 class I SAM-dependent methyltransferase [Phenylobacterium sp.]
MPSAERDSFNAVAKEYDAVRPTYPAQLFADLAAVVGGPGQRVLEVGCGSGQATRGLLERQWDVVALDPGAELIALAKAQLKGPLELHVARFEDFDPPAGAFRLVTSAQAWHWVDPYLGFPKVHEALEPGGVFAIFGHVPMASPQVLERLEPVYAAIAPDLWGPPPEAWYLPQGPVRAMFDATGMFKAVTHRAYAWTEVGSAESFVRQLATRSYVNAIEPPKRAHLLAEIRTALAPLGDLALQNETHLYWASLKP